MPNPSNMARNDEEQSQPDEQARAEVNANLNRPMVRLEREQRLTLLEARERRLHQILDNYDAPKRDEDYGWRLSTNDRIVDLIEDLKDRLALVERECESLAHATVTWKERFETEIQAVFDLHSKEIERSSLLESAVKRYASHVWNDLKRSLEDL